MTKWIRVLGVFWAAMGLLLTGVSQAQISVPEDARFVFQLDLQAVQKTKLGQKLLEAGREAAMKELAKQTKGESIDDPLQKVAEVLGFDPLREVQRLVVTASDYEHPEKSLTLWLHLKKTTGNLEGLLLGLPNYESETYGAFEIHSAKPDKDRVYGVIHRDASENHTVILSPNRATLEHQLDLLESSSKVRSGFKTIELTSDVKTLMSVQVLKLPVEEMGEGPHVNVAKRVKSLSLAIQEEDDDVDLRLSLETDTEKQAEQIRQMVQGLVAMVEFAKSMEETDADLQRVAEFMKDAKATIEGSTVRLRLRLPADVIDQVLREME